MRARQLVASAMLLGLSACSNSLPGVTLAPQTAAPSSRSPRSALTPFYGLDVPHANITQANKLSSQLGFQPTVLSTFIRLDSTSTADTMRAMQAAHVTPFVTLEPWHAGVHSNEPDPLDALARIIDGTHDAELRQQAHALATYHGRIYLRFAHEMNGSYYPWGVGTNGNTAAQYVQAWRHVHDLFGTIAGLDLAWVWSPLNIESQGAHGPVSQLYPGNAYVDDVGMTAYEHRSGRAQNTFDAMIKVLTSFTTKPIILAEIGVDSPAKSEWLASLGAYLMRTRHIIGFVYFQTRKSTGATGNYALQSQEERSAFATSLGQIAANRTS
ncbi:MAG: hypothetical protein M3N95_02495 [Actinomycetota bacterium]|nr:hypothetical protein [Actinomycetota bacterium]